MPPADAGMRRLLAINAYLVYELSIAPQGTRRGALFARMEHPQIGDLVLEVSRFSPARFDGSDMGELLTVTEEPLPNDGSDPRAIATETYYTIRDINGTIRRWHDCHFIAVPNCLTVDPISFFPDKQIGLPR